MRRSKTAAQPSVQEALSTLQSRLQTGQTIGMHDFHEVLSRQASLDQGELRFMNGVQLSLHGGQRVSLLYAATQGARQSSAHESVARLLVAAGADVNTPETGAQPTAPGQTVFLESVAKNRMHIATMALQRSRADISGCTPSGEWVVHLAFTHAQAMATSLAKELILRRSSVRAGTPSELPPAKDTRQWIRNLKTLPRLSEWTELSPTCTTLIEQSESADTAMEHIVTMSSLSNAVSEWFRGFIGAVQASCADNERCDLDRRLPMSGNWFQLSVYNGTLVHALAALGLSGMATELVRAGASEFAQDAMGATPAHIAARSGFFSFPGALQLSTELGISSRPQFSYIHRLQLSPAHADNVNTVDNGGWGKSLADVLPVLNATLGQDLHTRCDIDEATNEFIEPEQFFERYVLGSRPVVIRQGSSDWPWAETWSRRKLLERYGHMTFNVSDVPYKDNFDITTRKSQNQKTLSLTDYLAQTSEPTTATGQLRRVVCPDAAPQYLFSSSIETDLSRLASEIPTPSMMNFSYRSSTEPRKTNYHRMHLQFFLGPPWSGAPPHFHNHAWNSLAFGTKLWLLWPPGMGFYSGRPLLSFLTEVLPHFPKSRAPLVVTQHAGDIIFVPSRWTHAVLNLQESIGVAEEFTWSS